MSNGLHKIEIRRKSRGYGFDYYVVAVFVDGKERILYDGPSYIDACRVCTAHNPIP